MYCVIVRIPVSQFRYFTAIVITLLIRCIEHLPQPLMYYYYYYVPHAQYQTIACQQLKLICP